MPVAPEGTHHDRQHDRDPQGRRSLRPDRHCKPGGAHSQDRRGRGSVGDPDDTLHGVSAGRARRARPRSGRRARHDGRRACRGRPVPYVFLGRTHDLARPGAARDEWIHRRPRPHPFHVRVHRGAEGRRHHARQRDRVRRVGGGLLRNEAVRSDLGASAAAFRPLDLRHLRVVPRGRRAPPRPGEPQPLRARS